MTQPPIDLDGEFAKFYSRIGSDRGDEHVLHASDLGGCLYATYTRLQGMPQLPFDNDSRAAFLMGFAVEDYVGGALDQFARDGFVVTKGREIEHDGIVGHLDYDLERDGRVVAVIDARTTKGKILEVKYDHALKSAFYAHALGAEWFCEWMFQLGFGKVIQAKAFWLQTKDYVDDVKFMIPLLQTVRQGVVPEPFPPRGETWRCKSYCSAPCPRNERLEAIPL